MSLTLSDVFLLECESTCSQDRQNVSICLQLSLHHKMRQNSHGLQCIFITVYVNAHSQDSSSLDACRIISRCLFIVGYVLGSQQDLSFVIVECVSSHSRDLSPDSCRFTCRCLLIFGCVYAGKFAPFHHQTRSLSRKRLEFV